MNELSIINLLKYSINYPYADVCIKMYHGDTYHEKEMIYITKADLAAIGNCKEKMNQAVFLAEESREAHTANYPPHNRYFSNGDKPWVILICTKNNMKLNYLNKEYLIKEGELVLFDDNIMHAWEMKNNDMTIYYYRAKTDNPIKQGTYCLDGYF